MTKFKVTKFIKEFDEFGQEQNFNISRNQKFQTFVGGCIYLSIIALFIFNFSMEMIKYIEKSDPELTISESFITDKEDMITYQENELIFTIRGIDGTIKEGSANKKTYDLLQYFNILSMNVITSDTNILETIRLDSRKCDEKDDKLKTNKTICVYVPKGKSIKLNGDWSYDHTSYISSKLNFCNPKEDSNCLGKDKFFEFLDKTENYNYFSIKMKNTIFHPEDYNEPLQVEDKLLFILNSKNIKRTLDVNQRKVEVESDIGGIFNIVDNSVKGREIAQVFNNFIFSDDFKDNSQYFRIYIKGFLTKKVYKRVYAFIEDWIEDTTIFCGWVTMLLQFFYSFYNNYRFRWFMFKRIVNFEDNIEESRNMNANLLDINKEHNKIIQDRVKKDERKRNNSFEDKFKNFDEIHNDKSELRSFTENHKNPRQNIHNISHIKNNLIKEEKLEGNKTILSNNEIERSRKVFQGLTHNIHNKRRYYFTYICSSMKKSKEDFYKCFDQISYHIETKFDIFYYLKKIRNLKILKKLILEENTQKLFTLASNKHYSTSKVLHKKEKKGHNMFSQEEFLQIINSLDESNEINRKIIKEIFN